MPWSLSSNVPEMLRLASAATLAFLTASGAEEPSVCLIGEHSGIPGPDPRVAVLICGELRKQGVPVGEPVYEAPGSATIYSVRLHRLGGDILVRLSQEAPDGSVLAERRIQVSRLEEMVPAAPRLVEALVHRKSISATADVESIVEEEARPLRKIPVTASGELGILGVFGLGSDEDTSVKPGFKISDSYERPPFSLTMGVMFSGEIETSDGDDLESVEFGPFGIGGRYFFTKANFSPFVGGGMNYIFSKEGNSLGVSSSTGIEGFRFSQFGFRAELRVDKPFTDLQLRHVPVAVGLSLLVPATVK